jgi:hypothetical protein
MKTPEQRTPRVNVTAAVESGLPDVAQERLAGLEEVDAFGRLARHHAKL